MNIGEELEKLRALHESGALSDAEYAQAKARALGEGSAVPGATATSGSTGGDFLHRLHRSRADRWLGGVCGGLARQMGIPSWTLRMLFVLLACVFFTGFLFYVLLWIFVPEEPAAGSGG